jgi:DNA-binding LacI/PurR family transcriptional regulator
VSPTTVSHVLNDKGRVDARTRVRVRSVAKDMGYRPSLAARGLASGRTFTLGLSLPQVSWQPLRELIASEWSSHMIVCTAQRAIERHYSIAVLPDLVTVEDCTRSALDGVLVLDPIMGDPRLDLLGEAGIARVALGRDPAHPEVPSVAADMAGGLRELLGHLRERGAGRILLIAAPAKWHHYAEEAEAAQAWAAETRVFVARREVGRRAKDRMSVVSAAADAAGAALRSPSPPDAIVGLLSEFGASILNTATAAGLSVPGDVRVAQDVDSPSARAVIPAITALDPRPDLQAHAAVDLLIDAIEGRDVQSMITTPVTLRVRASS